MQYRCYAIGCFFNNSNKAYARELLILMILRNSISLRVFTQFVVFKPLSYCFEETIGFHVKASFASRPVSRLIRWYNKPGDIL